MSLFKVPPLALLSCVVLGVSGIFAGVAIGTWIVPLAAALAHGGWSEILAIPVTELVFAQLPRWMEEDTVLLVIGLLLQGLVALTGMAVGLATTLAFWRYLVVKRMKWMTDQEVEEFFKRQPDF